MDERGGDRGRVRDGVVRAAGGRPATTLRAIAFALAAGLASGCGADEGAPPEPSSEPAEPVRADDVLDAAWSPDGRRLAVTWDRGAGARVYGLLAGTDSTPADAGRGLPLSPGRAARASWSPDGLWIAYESGGDLHRMRPDGTGEEPLTRSPAPESHPAYAPDGTRLAFVAPRAGGEPPALWIMEADGGDPRPLPVPVSGAWSAPTWHPSGGALVAEAETDDGVALYRVEAETGSAERVARGSDPAFSPEGDILYFARGDSVFRMPWGSGPREEAEGGAGEVGGAAGAEEAPVVAPGRLPRPAPDGVRLAFVRGNPPTRALYVLHLETGEVRRLTAEPPPRPRPGAPGGEAPGRRSPEGGGG